VPRTPTEVLIFTVDDRAEVLGAMGELDPRGGWLTLQPGFDAEAAAESPGPSLLRSPKAAAPVCTWVPGERSRRSGEHVALGIEHGLGSAAADRLAEREVTVPGSWEIVQDNAGRGLVIAAPPASPHHDVLDWLLRAGVALSAAPLTGEWRALVHRR
jgi:hypothetical protein